MLGRQTAVGLELAAFWQLDGSSGDPDNGPTVSDQLRELFDSVRSRLHADVDAQLATVAERHYQALAEARTVAERETEARWTTRLESTREERTRQAAAAAQAVARELRHTVLDDLREIDAARSITDTLNAIVRVAARQAPRAALFVGTEDRLQEWPVDGASSLIDSRQTTVAVPLLLEGEQVALLCGDSDPGADPAEDGWPDALTIIASHGASRLAFITALKTAQAVRGLASAAPTSSIPGTPVTAVGSSSSDEEEQSARRYARLLVSEIKLYNEAAVKSGREHRDLSRRLATEIDRARRVYDQRVSTELKDRRAWFDDELIQTLAGGDGSLL